MLSRAEHRQRYGWPHRRRRAAVAREVEAGRAVCSRCGRLIAPGEPFDLDHVDDAGPTDYLGAAHVGCNRGAANKRRAKRGKRWGSRAW